MSEASKVYKARTKWSDVGRYLHVLFKHLTLSQQISLLSYYLSAARHRGSGRASCKEQVFDFPKFKVYADPTGLSAAAMMFLAELLKKDPYKQLNSDSYPIDSCILDVGANAGFFTLIRCSGNPRMNVTCIEPHPDTFGLLKRNIELNNLTDRIQIHNLAIGAENGTLTMAQRRHSSMLTPQSAAESDAQPIEVPMSTLDTVVEESGRTFMAAKIDVEGYEVEVLKGASHTLKTLKALIIEIHDTEAEDGCREILEEAGFKCEMDRAVMVARR